MKVTRDVIVDLLPLYLADEASPDTRALVVAYLSGDKELAERIRTQSADMLRPAIPTGLPPELELSALTRTRAMLAWTRWLFGLAIAFSVLTLTTKISFNAGHIDSVRLLLSDYPAPFAACLVLAIGCWAAYFSLRRRLRTTRL